MYIYKVFEHLKQLWMGIWQHTHTVTTTEVSPDLGEFAEILGDVSVEMIPHISQFFQCKSRLFCTFAFGQVFITITIAIVINNHTFCSIRTDTFIIAHGGFIVIVIVF